MSDDLGQGSVEQSIPAVSAEHSEKMLRQSEVNDIVGRAKADAASRAVEQYKRSQQDSQPAQHTNQTSNTEYNEDRIRKMAGEEAQRLRDEWMSEAQTRNETEAAQRIVKTFYDKIADGKDKYDDFEKVTGDLELSRFPNTVHMLAEFVDNSSDVLYELSKNRAKMARLEMTAREFPQEALHDLKRLGESIKANQSANTRKIPNAPLSQQRPTNVGTDSGSVMSMRDLKNKYKA